MPHLDFREALSTPEEQTNSAFAVPAMIDSAFMPPPIVPAPFRLAIRLSRSGWTNIVFVAIASIGGLVSGFYFFNGMEVVRAAASWPAEFLYPRPVSIEKVEAIVQPTAVDQFGTTVGSIDSKSDSAARSSDQDVAASNLSLADVNDPTGGESTGFPVQQPPAPPPGSVQSVETTVEQTIPSVPPVPPAPPVPSRQTIAGTGRTTVSSGRSKITSNRKKISMQLKSVRDNSGMTSSSQSSAQTQSSVNSAGMQTQMIGGGFGGVGGGLGGGAMGGFGSSLGGGLGGTVGGIGGTVGSVGGGVVGGHH